MPVLVGTKQVWCICTRDSTFRNNAMYHTRYGLQFCGSVSQWMIKLSALISRLTNPSKPVKMK